MSKHDHDDCQHELAYCEQHDVAYCSRCDEEWGKWEPCTISHAYLPYIYPSVPTIIDPVWTTTIDDTTTIYYPGTSIAHSAC